MSDLHRAPFGSPRLLSSVDVSDYTTLLDTTVHTGLVLFPGSEQHPPEICAYVDFGDKSSFQGARRVLGEQLGVSIGWRDQPRVNRPLKSSGSYRHWRLTGSLTCPDKVTLLIRPLEFWHEGLEEAGTTAEGYWAGLTEEENALLSAIHPALAQSIDDQLVELDSAISEQYIWAPPSMGPTQRPEAPEAWRDAEHAVVGLARMSVAEARAGASIGYGIEDFRSAQEKVDATAEYARQCHRHIHTGSHFNHSTVASESGA